MSMIERFDLPTGARYLRIPHYADPAKDQNWLDAVRVEMKDTPDQFRREILMDDTVYEGQPVYETYQDGLHCPIKYRTSPIPVIPGSIYFGGWDAGQTLNPAFCLLQVTPNPFQIHCLLEVCSSGGESMNEFAPRVLLALEKRIPGSWLEVRHYGDATIMTKSGVDGRTAQSEAKRHGIRIVPVSNVWAPRKAAVSWMLTRMLGEDAPGFLLDGLGCPTLRQGFQGAYKLNTSPSGDQAGAGAIYLAPLKNMFSHIHDSLQYPAIKIRQMILGEGATLQEND